MKINKIVITGILGLYVFSGLMAETSKKSTVTETKTWEKNFDVNSSAQVNLTCRQSDLSISTWDQNVVDVKITLTVEAYDPEEINRLVEAFEPSISGNANGVSIQNPDCVSETITHNKTRVKINNEVIKVKRYRYTIDIKMPELNHLDAKIRFSTVNLGSHKGRVNLAIYECELNAAKMSPPEAQIDIKFSNGNIGSAKAMTLNAYECQLGASAVKSLKMDCKFSEIVFNQVVDSEVSAYESDIDLGITNSVRLKHNFGKVSISEANNLELTAYEMKLLAGRIDHVTITSGKFSKITLGSTKSLNVVSAYESDFLVSSTESLKINSRFCKIDIGSLSQSLDTRSYESEFRINNISADFEHIIVDARFTSMELNLKGNKGYQLEANMSFGGMEIPASDLSGIKINKGGSKYVARGYALNQNDNSQIKVKGYETNIRILRE